MNLTGNMEFEYDNCHINFFGVELMGAENRRIEGGDNKTGNHNNFILELL